MLNYIWLGLIVLAVLLGAATGQLDAVQKSAFDACETSINLALKLAGIMALWLGLMRLAEKSGIIHGIAALLRPILRWLFPEVPANHPAMGSMVMNMAANMLGLNNAATPLGLKAMQDLEKLNPFPGTATNAMCTFLAINTSSIQLIPATTVAILAANGSQNPTAIIGTALLATTCSTVAAVASVKFFQRLPVFAIKEVPRQDTSASDESAEAAPLPELPTAKMNPKIWAILLTFSAVFLWLGSQMVMTPERWEKGPLIAGVETLSLLIIPFLLAFFPLFAALQRVPIYEEFIEGAKEGVQVAIRIVPYLVAILVAIGMLRGAGGIDWLSAKLGPALAAIHFPAELLPLVLIRPLSGSGANGIFADLVAANGPDSLISRMGATVMGSTETTFYVIAVYFGSVAIRRTRHAVAAGLIADLTGVVAAIIICNLAFGSG